MGRMKDRNIRTEKKIKVTLSYTLQAYTPQTYESERERHFMYYYKNICYPLLSMCKAIILKLRKSAREVRKTCSSGVKDHLRPSPFLMKIDDDGGIP